jgi:hypothetical protein
MNLWSLLFCMLRLSIISLMITKQMCTVLVLYFGSSWHPRFLCYFIWACNSLQTMRLSVSEPILIFETVAFDSFRFRILPWAPSRQLSVWGRLVLTIINSAKYIHSYAFPLHKLLFVETQGVVWAASIC